MNPETLVGPVQNSPESGRLWFFDWQPGSEKLTYSSGERNITRNMSEAKEGISLGTVARSDEPANV
ncbi:hypothetical protein [Nitrosospira briensis]|uniref:hypothetical protein n=1 Tax=Nitrosospira briensis TaxID=35799 RepID=UPI0012E135B6|nr:hypothetical protein [Nitrosospira briensis]